jgi:hypothetical protein
MIEFEKVQKKLDENIPQDLYKDIFVKNAPDIDTTLSPKDFLYEYLNKYRFYYGTKDYPNNTYNRSITDIYLIMKYYYSKYSFKEYFEDFIDLYRTKKELGMFIFFCPDINKIVIACERSNRNHISNLRMLKVNSILNISFREFKTIANGETPENE